MAPRYFSCFARLLIMLIAVILFFSLFGEGAPICQRKCEDVPGNDCDGFCRNLGFNGGTCQPPLFQFCCCNSNSN
ncbi:hypothetical protein COLO4_34087 [Corchorus olitorius]|uniref:Uncharacterized protein n=1 Tax=Corchorus olitorius TaxID=93759 RepID=A0A1R3GNT6_9ROSI|nr:hypothetical protein COLO4_34087 [Corchorus olitorius]